VPGRVTLVGAELVEVVVGGDVLPLGLRLSGHRPAALLDGRQSGLGGAGRAGEGQRRQGAAAGDELAPPQVEPLGGDLRAGDGGCAVALRHGHVLPYGRRGRPVTAVPGGVDASILAFMPFDALPEITEVKETLAGTRKTFHCHVIDRQPGALVVLFVSK